MAQLSSRTSNVLNAQYRAANMF